MRDEASGQPRAVARDQDPRMADIELARRLGRQEQGLVPPRVGQAPVDVHRPDVGLAVGRADECEVAVQRALKIALIEVMHSFEITAQAELDSICRRHGASLGKGGIGLIEQAKVGQLQTVVHEIFVLSVGPFGGA